MHEIGLAFDTQHVLTELQTDIAIFRAINVTGIERLHERYGLGEPCLEVGKGFSVSSCFGTSTPASRAAAPLARSAAIWIWRTNGSMSGASRSVIE